MKRMLPIGIQDFKKLRELNATYVDKTEILHKLITEGSYYFLSRPRRFGKSLTISTLNEIFEGNKDLFKGLYIYDKIEWKKRPIIRIDFTTSGYREIGLDNAIQNMLRLNATKYEIELNEKGNRDRFGELIRALVAKFGEKVAVLIDEYDKPIIDNLTEIEKAEENREILKDFYGVIKPMDPYLEFVLLTGVTKFSKVAIFSDLNNLLDITTSASFSEIVGWAKEEIEENFKDYIAETCKQLNVTNEAFHEKLKFWYNGYSWDSKKFVYNPFSILRFFVDKSFENFWFATGTPTFLVNFIRDKGLNANEIEQRKVDSIFFDKFDISKIDIISLMFQTGYLTIKDKDEDGFFTLDYPNEEVRTSFSSHLMESYSGRELSDIGETTNSLLKSLRKNDIETFTDSLNALFASIPHQIFIEKFEAYYHSIIYLALKLLGVYIECEVSTNKGRIDAVIKTKTHVFVIEFKLTKAIDALNQIKENSYHEKYLTDSRNIVLVGIGFSKRRKKISGYFDENIDKNEKS